jgi:hypothetical protein
MTLRTVSAVRNQWHGRAFDSPSTFLCASSTKGLFLQSLCTIAQHRPYRHHPAVEQQPRRAPNMSGTYAPWLHQAILLQVASGDLRVVLRGTIVGETANAVRFRLEPNWEIDIFKNMILSVEEDNGPCVPA